MLMEKTPEEKQSINLKYRSKVQTSPHFPHSNINKC